MRILSPTAAGEGQRQGTKFNYYNTLRTNG